VKTLFLYKLNPSYPLNLFKI